MLSLELKRTWDATAPPLRIAAMARAESILGKLTHYPAGRKSNYDEDVQMMAANLLHYHERRSDHSA